MTCIQIECLIIILYVFSHAECQVEHTVRTSHTQTLFSVSLVITWRLSFSTWYCRILAPPIITLYKHYSNAWTAEVKHFNRPAFPRINGSLILHSHIYIMSIQLIACNVKTWCINKWPSERSLTFDSKIWCCVGWHSRFIVIVPRCSIVPR